MGIQFEDISSQIDGVTDTFTTTFSRDLAQITLFHNGSQVKSSQFTEVDADTIQTTFIPLIGDSLFVQYDTDQVPGGRVVGFFADPSGSGPLPLTLEQRLDALDDRIDVTEVGITDINEKIGKRFDPKESVQAASVADIPGVYNSTGGASGRGELSSMPLIVDGVSLQAGHRVLLKDQTSGDENGIWTVITLGTGADGVWERADDFDQDADVTQGARTHVAAGIINASTFWILTNPDPVIIGGTSGTSLSWTTGASPGFLGLTTQDKNQAVASATSGDNANTGLTITQTPDGAVSLYVEGSRQSLGNGSKLQDAYFSRDGGTTALLLNALLVGDTLFWNGVIAGFNLLPSYRVDFEYIEA